jgi:hypothetical protein
VLAVGLRGGRAVSGVLARSGRQRAELRTAKGPAYAEWSEATPETLARFAKADPRRVALLSLLEGDVEAARATGVEGLPPKLWDYAAGAKPPPPPADEQEARELFYAAEREFASMESRAAAIEKYRRLKTDLGATPLARGEMDRILRRSEAGKEYVLTGSDLRFGGTFKRSKDGAIIAAKDTDPQEAVENVVEAEFGALPGTSYRAWLLLGGCCREVLTFYLQGTEMTASDKGKRVSIEPGGNRADVVPSTASGLKKEHREHAKNKEPKMPTKWDWVALALPKYATPGLKKIRLMTHQQGLGVQHVVVSSLRTAPPKPAELEELLKARAQDAPPPPSDPDLVLYWSFDDSDGAFADLAGRDFTGMPKGGVKRTPGRLGGAAEFDGTSGVVEAKDAPELRLVGDMTIAFWVRKSGEAQDWARMVGKGDEKRRNYGVWESPKDDKRVLWQIYSENGQGLNLTSNGSLEVGRWHHVAVTRRGQAGAIHLDGRKDVESAGEGTPWTSDDPLTVGFGIGGGHVHFPGAIDDLRIYSRALTPEEISALYDAGR